VTGPGRLAGSQLPGSRRRVLGAVPLPPRQASQQLLGLPGRLSLLRLRRLRRAVAAGREARGLPREDSSGAPRAAGGAQRVHACTRDGGV